MGWSYTALTEKGTAKYIEIVSNDGFIFVNGNSSSTKTLSASLVGFSATEQQSITYQWYKNNVSMQGKTQSSLLLTGATESKGVYKCVATLGSDTYQDVVTVDAVSDGAGGSSPYLFSVSNENFSIATDNSLKPLSALNYDVVFTGYHGSTRMTAVASSATPTTGQFKITGTSAFPYTENGIKISQPTNGTIRFAPSTSTAILENKTVTLTVTYFNDSTNATATETKTVTISAAKTGDDGHSPVVTATKSGTTTTIKVDGETQATINDGAKGENAIVMTSASTPSGTYNGQVGIWQGQIYIWNGTQWENQTNILPTDAVLHYSFDEVPDYPDGTADVRLINNTYDLQSMSQYFRVNAGVGATISNVNGNIKVTVTTGGKYRGVNIPNIYIKNKVVKLKISILSCSGAVVVDNGVNMHILTTDKVGTYEVSCIGNAYTTTNNALFVMSNYAYELTIDAIYIGDGSYSTPIIDNANGQNNATNNGGIAVKGVSGKGAYFLNGKYANVNTSLTANFSISFWIKPDNNTNNLEGTILRNNQILLRNGTSGENYLMLILAGANGTLVDRKNIGSLFTPNQWTNLVLTRNGTTLNVYRDGVKTSTITLSDGTIQTDASLTIMYANVTRPQSLDDLLIFDRALSEKEVLALYYNKANTPKYYELSDYIVEGVDDDGLISPSEKQVLYQKWIDIYAVLNGTAITSGSNASGEYSKMITRANTAGVSLVTQGGEGLAYINATEALRAGLWTTANLANMSVQTKVTAGAIDTLFNNYRNAYEALSTAIDVQNKATASALSISQSNAYHQIPTNSSGTATTYIGTDNTIYLLEGESKLSCVATGTTLAKGQWKITRITYTSCSGATTASNYTISDKGAVIDVLNGISADSAKRTFTIQFYGNNATSAETISIIQSFAKSKAGADGSSYRLIADSNCVKTGTTVTFDAQKITGDRIGNYSDGYLYKKEGSNSWTQVGQFKSNSAYAQKSVPISQDTIFRLCRSASASNFVDEVSVRIFADGHSPTVSATPKQNGSVDIQVDGSTIATINDGTQGTRAIRYLGKYNSWQASKAYVVGDVVINKGDRKRYTCKTAHTSGSTFSATNWTLNETYISGDWYFALTDGKMYLAGSSTFAPDTMDATNYRVLDAIQDIIEFVGDTSNSSKTGYASCQTLANGYAEALVAGTVLANKIFSKEITLQTGGVIQSEYEEPSASSQLGKGFKLTTDGVIRCNDIYVNQHRLQATYNYLNANLFSSVDLKDITGSGNTFINAGTVTCTSGSHNIFIGNNSGYGVTTGIGNFIIRNQRGAPEILNNPSELTYINDAIKHQNGVLYVNTYTAYSPTWEKVLSVTSENITSTTGCIKFSNGLMLQWGVITASGTFSFPIAFNNRPLFVANGRSTVNGSIEYDEVPKALSGSQYKLNSHYTDVDWFAIGY